MQIASFFPSVRPERVHVWLSVCGIEPDDGVPATLNFGEVLNSEGNYLMPVS